MLGKYLFEIDKKNSPATAHMLFLQSRLVVNSGDSGVKCPFNKPVNVKIGFMLHIQADNP
jgi:hypothetical protein